MPAESRPQTLWHDITSRAPSEHTIAIEATPFRLRMTPSRRSGSVGSTVVEAIGTLRSHAEGLHRSKSALGAAERQMMASARMSTAAIDDQGDAAERTR